MALFKENFIDTVSDRVTETLPWTKAANTAHKPEEVLDKTIRNTLRNGTYTPGEEVGKEEFRKQGNKILNTVKESKSMSYLDNLYNPEKAQRLSEAATEKTGVSMGVGLGVPYATANKLWEIPINQYQDSDASFVGDGDDPKTSQVNIPATLAAKTAGGAPYGLTLKNGINKRTGDGYFRLKPLRDDNGQNG